MNKTTFSSSAHRVGVSKRIGGRLIAGLAVAAVALVAAPAGQLEPAAAYAPPRPQMIATPPNDLQAWIAYLDRMEQTTTGQPAAGTSGQPGDYPLPSTAVCYEIVGDDMFPVDCNPPAELNIDTD